MEAGSTLTRRVVASVGNLGNGNEPASFDNQAIHSHQEDEMTQLKTANGKQASSKIDTQQTGSSQGRPSSKAVIDALVVLMKAGNMDLAGLAGRLGTENLDSKADSSREPTSLRHQQQNGKAMRLKPDRNSHSSQFAHHSNQMDSTEHDSRARLIRDILSAEEQEKLESTQSNGFCTGEDLPMTQSFRQKMKSFLSFDASVTGAPEQALNGFFNVPESQLASVQAKAKQRMRDGFLLNCQTDPDKISEQTRNRLAKFNATKVERHLSLRNKVERFLDGMAFTICLTLVVMAALIVNLIQLYGMSATRHTERMDFVTSVMFAVEVLIRMWAMGPLKYMTTPLCFVDFTITLLDWITVAVGEDMDLSLLRVIRAVRLVKITRISRLAHHSGESTTFDSDGKLVAYSPDQLFSSGFFKVTGNILQMAEVWIQWLFLVILTSLFGVVICPPRCKQSADIVGETFGSQEGCTTCITGFGADTGLMFGALVAFLLGIFDSMTFYRWWQIRQIFGGILEEIQDCSVFMTCYLPPATERGTIKKKYSDYFRFTIARYINLGIFLAHKRVTRSNNYSDLVKLGLLTQPEWDLLEESTDQYNHIYFWSSMLLREAAEQEVLLYPHRTVFLVQNSILKQQMDIAKMLIYLDSQVPYAFTHLVVVIVKVHLLLCCAVSGTYIGEGVYEGQVFEVVWGFALITMTNLLFEGLLRIHVILYNPFSPGINSFPAERFLHSTWTNTLTMLEDYERVPFTMSAPKPVRFKERLDGPANNSLFAAEEAEEDLL